MVSTIGQGGFIGQVLKGFGLDKGAGSTPSAAIRGEDTITLSPQSLAMQETIRQNGEAATAILGDLDNLTSDTAAALGLLA